MNIRWFLFYLQSYATIITISVMSKSSRPHGLQPTRLLCPWDFPGKSTRDGGAYWAAVYGVTQSWTPLKQLSSSSSSNSITIYFQNIFITPKRNSIPVEKLLGPPPSSPPGLWPQISSVQFSRSVVSDSLWPHGLQHIRLPCPSLTLTACSNSCSLSQWCHPTISSSVVPFSSCS